MLKIKQHVIRYWDSQFEGISTRLDKGKRRYFNSKNIKKLQILKKLLHTDGKSHHSLIMAKNIIEGNITGNRIKSSSKPINQMIDLDKLVNVSDNLKSLIKAK